MAPGPRCWRCQHRTVSSAQSSPWFAKGSSGHRARKKEEARKLIQAGIHDTAAITRPYALPPGTPKDRVQILRRAFEQTMKDKDFLAETVKSKLDVDPMSGEEVEKIVSGLFKLDSATVARMSEVLK